MIDDAKPRGDRLHHQLVFTRAKRPTTIAPCWCHRRSNLFVGNSDDTLLKNLPRLGLRLLAVAEAQSPVFRRLCIVLRTLMGSSNYSDSYRRSHTKYEAAAIFLFIPGRPECRRQVKSSFDALRCPLGVWNSIISLNMPKVITDSGGITEGRQFRRSDLLDHQRRRPYNWDK